MTADRWSDLIALFAGVVGLVVVLRTWPRLPRRTQAARLRHPSTPPPVTVGLETLGPEAHWRVSVPEGSLPTAVDIVTWRPVGSALEWQPEPIVEPIMLQPGSSAVLPLAVPDPTATHLVVVAWTVQHPDGDIQGARTLTIEPTAVMPSVDGTPRRTAGWSRLAVSIMLAGLLVVLVLLAGWRVLDGDTADDEGAAPAVAASTTGTPSTVTVVPAPSTTATTVTSTSNPMSASTSTSTTVATTTAAATTTTTMAGTPTTTSATTTSTTTSTTSAAAATTTPATTSTIVASSPPTAPSGRRIDVRGRVEDCRFGADCLIASFSAIGFPADGNYVCEFDDGSRFTFGYAGGGGLDACAASGADPSITIEIDGVRSATITRQAPNGG